MSKRPQRNHAAAFKAKAALEAIKSEKTVTEIAQRFDVHPNQVTDWRQQLLERAVDVFGSTATPTLNSRRSPLDQLAPYTRFDSSSSSAPVSRNRGAEPS
jgi:transposase-like protein